MRISGLLSSLSEYNIKQDGSEEYRLSINSTLLEHVSRVLSPKEVEQSFYFSPNFFHNINPGHIPVMPAKDKATTGT